MEKLKPETYDKDYFIINNLFSTKYDYLFNDNIIERGFCYYSSNKVMNFKKTKNKISAVVKGTNNYHVSVEYLNNDKLKVKCECLYHKETNPYCKHVYALILTLKMIYEKDKMIYIYNINCNKIKNILYKIEQMLNSNKKYIKNCSNWWNNVKINNIKILEEMESKFDKTKDLILSNLVRDSYYYLNNIIRDYNSVVDYIEKDIKKTEKQKEEKSKKTNESKTLYEIDDQPLFDDLDEFFAELPLPILEYVRKQDIEKGSDTEIMDKAIKERKKRDEIIRKEEKQQKIQDEEDKKLRKKYKKELLFGFLSGLFEDLNSKSKSSNNDYLMPWEQDLVNKGEYEPYNFEEDKTEEEDFYYEDD